MSIERYENEVLIETKNLFKKLYNSQDEEECKMEDAE